jgi:hypothetical protein
MTVKIPSRIWPIAFAIVSAFLVFEVTTLRGQIDSADESDLVFDSPLTPSNNAIRQANATSVSEQSTGTKPGKPAVTQTSGTTTSNSTRAPIPGTNPKSYLNNKPGTSYVKKPAATTSNAAATVSTPTAFAAPTTSVPVTATQSPTAVVTPTAMTPAVETPQATNQTSMPALATTGSTPVTPASHLDPLTVVDRDGGDATQLRKVRRVQNTVVVTTSPAESNGPPGVRGALFGLSGTTATERLFQLQNQFLTLQRESDELRRENAIMMSRVKESQEQLMAGVREIQLARKELTVARGDLDRLRNDLQNLREKVRMAEKEHSAVLQTIGPLLQQLLEVDEVSSLPPSPVERD